MSVKPNPARANDLTLTINLCWDGEYWVAQCKELGTLTANPDRAMALVDLFRVNFAHLKYGLHIGRTLDECVTTQTGAREK